LQHARWDVAPTAGGLESDVLRYQLPVAMLRDLRRQLEQHSALGRLGETLEEVPRVRRELGFPPLVGPIRQLIAAQAVYNVLGGPRARRWAGLATGPSPRAPRPPGGPWAAPRRGRRTSRSAGSCWARTSPSASGPPT